MKYTLLLVATLVAHSPLVAQVPPKPEVNQRLSRQNTRINKGVQTGELTRRESHRLRTQERGLHDEVRDERIVNGGKLNPTERRQVNRDLNQSSRRINRLKNNARVQP